MTFKKLASVTVIASAVPSEDGGLRKIASHTTARSYYIDGSRKLDVAGLLGRVADKYAISANPSDYFFEAIRANTTNIPNENHDAFHQSELLRFDLRMGMPVYQSYVGKPHHVNHRTENPKTARGVIVDVHYNIDAPALETCPTQGCNNKTAERSNRDETGIHCSKCGTVVKDEFVEALVAVDTKKDPAFAEGVRTGQLKSSSMGCTCAYTVCNVCEHVATSRPEFCEHIKAGNKGTYWAKSSASWKRIEAKAAAAEFAKRKIKFATNDFCYMRAPDGFEVRKAYENCGDVEYDELSRVDQPADPKALQREILKAAGINSGDVPTADELRRESLELIKAATATRKSAQLSDELTQQLQAMDPEEARAAVEQALSGKDGDVIINIQDQDAGGAYVDMPPTGEPPQTIEDFTQDKLDGEPPPGAPPGAPDELTQEEMGVIPPGASKQEAAAEPAASTTRSARMYAKTYKDWSVEITAKGTAKVMSPRGSVMLIKASAAPKNEEDRRAFGREVLGHLFDHGLIKTAERYSAVLDAKFAQVVDYAVNDMQGYDDHQLHDSILDGGDQNDMAGVDKSKNTPDQIGDGEDNSDRAEKRDGAPDSAIEGGDADHGERNEMSPPDGKPVVTESQQGDMRDERQSPPDSALANETHDHKERLAAAQKHANSLEKLTIAKIAQVRKEAVEQVEAARKAERETIFRALRIVAKRHSRNLELSPLKEAFGVVLASERTIGQDPISGESLEYAPLPQDLVVHLIEAAWKDGGDAQIEELIRRASELAKSGDDYLKAAEADIERMAHVVPPVTSAALMDDGDVTSRAAELRQAARQGSMVLTSSNEETAPIASQGDKRTKIQAALGSNLLNKQRNQFRPN